MFKKLLIISILLASLLASCQDSGTTPTTEPTSVGETEVAATHMPTNEPTEEPTSVPTNTPAPTETSVPTETPEPFVFEPDLVESDCSFNEARISKGVTCYTLTVPEDHNAPENGRTITLPVAIFHNDSDTPAADPILYLSGGPGEDALESMELNFNVAFAPFVVSRDLVVFEQRGTGSSMPALDCPNVKVASLEYLDESLESEEAGELIVEGYANCYEQLASEGVNFTVYNSAQSAADVAMLREALGYEEWNLYALSYGTRLAQTILRDNDAGIRSVVLDSAYPIEVNLQTDTPANLKRAMDVFFAACANDEACNVSYSDLETIFWELVADMDENPRLLNASNLLTGEKYDVLLNGDGLVGTLFTSLYQAELTALFPQLIYNAHAGNNDLLTRFSSIGLTQIDFVSLGLQITVQCHEEMSFTDPTEAENAVTEFAELEGVFINSAVAGSLGLDVCAVWETGDVAAIENEPVSSDIPTLVIAGEHDPITPPAWGQQIANRFSQAFFFEYPGQGHGPGILSDCARSMILDFIEMPAESPDDSCMADMGFDFVVPANFDDIVLVPYTNETFGITGVVPEGWTEASPGVYSDGGLTALIQQAAPVPAEQLLSVLAGQLGLETLPDPIEELETDHFTWTLYHMSVEGVEVDLGVAEADGTTYLALMQTTTNDYEAFHMAVFLPVLEAFMPS